MSLIKFVIFSLVGLFVLLPILLLTERSSI